MPHFPAPIQQQGQILINDNGQSYLVTRLHNGQIQYEAIPQNPPQSHDPTAMALAITGIGVIGALLVGGICYTVGYTAGERSSARVVVCDRASEQFLFWGNSTVNCR